MMDLLNKLLKFNPYLRVSTGIDSSVVLRPKEKSMGDIDVMEDVLVRCIPYKQSYFTNLMEKYFIIDDKIKPINKTKK